MGEKRYKTFKEFYPYYLTEHSSGPNRVLHFIGTCLVLYFLMEFVLTLNWVMFLMIPISGYGFAWVGHFFVERNKPATFTYPLWSLGSDFVMFWHILTGQIGRKLAAAQETIKGENTGTV